ncbi:GntR family transcriptional regulator [Pseudonocardia sp. HH130630-07]|uniref:GntR family transcriptional regulator n=1 Tax=Pseudonocardia sp. HH130630-07 TaxID=1690815 RepID=UPI0009F25D9D
MASPTSACQLVDEFGVGRSSAREVVQQLACDGLVEVRHGHGIFAADPGPGRRAVAERPRRHLPRPDHRGLRGPPRGRGRPARRGPHRPGGARRLRTMLSERRSLLGRRRLRLRHHRRAVPPGRRRLGQDRPQGDVLIELLDDPSLPDTTGDHEALVAALEVRDADAAALATTPHFDLILRVLRTCGAARRYVNTQTLTLSIRIVRYRPCG